MVIDDQNLSGSETIEQEVVDKNVVGKTIYYYNYLLNKLRRKIEKQLFSK